MYREDEVAHILRKLCVSSFLLLVWLPGWVLQGSTVLEDKLQVLSDTGESALMKRLLPIVPKTNAATIAAQSKYYYKSNV